MRAVSSLAVLVLLFTAPAAFADKPGPPTTYKQLSADGRFVFVMLSPDSVETELLRWNEQFGNQIKAIRTVYSRSGLYKNDGSKEPLWTVDWHRTGVAVPADGTHLVRFGNWPHARRAREMPPDKEALKQEAVSFFARGKLLRSYTIGELVDRPEQLPRSVSHFRWLKSSAIDDGRQQFEAVTHDGNRILFDLKTGNIVTKARAQP
jgi:hypothetical protein